MAKGRLHVGTSGWNYRTWRHIFYPPELLANDYLGHYANRFDAVEINSTSYGMPTPETIVRWREAVPDGFVMALKAPQTITHVARLRGCGPLLRQFADCARLLQSRAGPLLFQLPPNLLANPSRLRGFLVEAQAYADPLPLVCEFRHRSWYRDEVFAILATVGVACCLHDMAGSAYDRAGHAPILYLRRHGTAGRYAGAYGAERLAPDANHIARWLAGGRDAYAFFNNTLNGEALADAALLRDLVHQRLAGPLTEGDGHDQ